jgi:putative transposase
MLGWSRREKTVPAAPSLYRRHRFLPAIISHAVYLYFRFTLSYRAVEELLAVRGIIVSYETIRRWCLKFGYLFAAELRRRRPAPRDRWHLDEMHQRIGRRTYTLHCPLFIRYRQYRRRVYRVF